MKYLDDQDRYVKVQKIKLAIAIAISIAAALLMYFDILT
jgi:hypothetical protein